MEIPGYEIIGELAVDREARRFLAKRTQDGADVLITLVSVPEGDAGNALNHLASDVKQMVANPHPSVVRVLDGRWVDDSFAIVTARTAHPSLEQLLIRREEEFPFVRIATVLRDINAALVWAREKGVVHRAIRLENVFVEPGSDRTCVSFAVRPIGLTDTPSEAEDSRTIAGLARAMFTRGRRPDVEDATLGELRPGLPASIVAATEALLGQRPEGDETPLPDITSYIASIAMAEALKEGEIHLEKNRNLIEEQQRQHQEQLEKERREHAEALAKEKAAHQKEREAHQRDRECYERDLEVLRIEREGYEREREVLRRERAEYDKEMSAILAQKARQRTREGVELVARGWRRRPMWTRRWTSDWKSFAPIIAGAALILIAAVALTQRERFTGRVADSAAGLVTRRPAPAAVPTPAQSQPVAAPVAQDSATAGNPQQPATAVNSPAAAAAIPAAFLESVRARAESAAVNDEPAYTFIPEGSRPQRPAPARNTEPREQRRADTIFTSPQLPPRDTTPRRDTTVRRDTLARRDTLPAIPDSVRRDTLSRH